VTLKDARLPRYFFFWRGADSSLLANILCVPKTLSVLMSLRNYLSCRKDQGPADRHGGRFWKNDRTDRRFNWQRMIT